jgi:hypothetical protein
VGPNDLYWRRERFAGSLNASVVACPNYKCLRCRASRFSPALQGECLAPHDPCSIQWVGPPERQGQWLCARPVTDIYSPGCDPSLGRPGGTAVSYRRRCNSRWHVDLLKRYVLSTAALSNAAPAIYFSGALRKHIILSRLLILIQNLRQKTFLNVWVLLNIFTLLLLLVVVGVVRIKCWW